MFLSEGLGSRAGCRRGLAGAGGAEGAQLLEYIYTKGPPITAGPTKGATPADKGTRYVVERTDYIFCF